MWHKSTETAQETLSPRNKPHGFCVMSSMYKYDTQCAGRRCHVQTHFTTKAQANAALVSSKNTGYAIHNEKPDFEMTVYSWAFTQQETEGTEVSNARRSSLHWLRRQPGSWHAVLRSAHRHHGLPTACLPTALLFKCYNSTLLKQMSTW